MKKIYLSVLASLAFLITMASPDIYTPELVAPNDNATGAAPNVELDWNAVTGQLGLYYEVQLSTSAGFETPVVFTTELSSFRTSNLLFGQQYYWRVRAIDNQGTSDWSVSRNFTVIVKPVIRRPNDNSSGAMPNVQVIWEAVAGIGLFDVQFDTASTFNSPAFRAIAVAGTLTQTNASNLLFAQKYFLRVRARHAADTSEWSVTRSFNVVDAFALKKPNDNSVDLSPDVQLEWNKIDGIEKYNIYMSTESDFTHFDTYVAAKNLLKTIPDTLKFGTHYYWKMDAIHALDTLTSNQFSFTVIDKVALGTPENNATNVELGTLLKWNKISGVLNYKLQLASNSAMNNALNYTIEATTTAGLEQFKVPANLLDSAATYYWRVQALSSKDTSDWSETWNFRCVALGIDNPTQLTGIRIYPVPAASSVNVQLKSNYTGKAVVALFDLLGKGRIEREVNITNGLIKDFQLGELPNGVYMLRTETNGRITTAKLIVKK